MDERPELIPQPLGSSSHKLLGRATVPFVLGLDVVLPCRRRAQSLQGDAVVLLPELITRLDGSSDPRNRIPGRRLHVSRSCPCSSRASA